LTRPENAEALAHVARLAGTTAAAARAVLDDVATSEDGDSNLHARVRAAAATLGYPPTARPTPIATLGTIGMVGSSVIARPFFGRILAGAHDAAAEFGMMLVLAGTSADRDLEDWDLRALLDRQPAGIIFVGPTYRLTAAPAALAAIPHVFVNSVAAGSGSRSVVADHAAAAYRAVEEFGRHGHRRIAFLTSHDSTFTSRARAEGYAAALGDLGVPVDPAVIVADEPTADGGRRGMTKLFGLGRPPGAVLCFNDAMAMGAYQAAAEHGVEIPAGLSVIAFDELGMVAPGMRPPLTTLDMPYYDMGRAAAFALLDILRSDPSHTGHQIALSCSLVWRQSVDAMRLTGPAFQQ
jgi:LacI family transcriptional regulator